MFREENVDPREDVILADDELVCPNCNDSPGGCAYCEPDEDYDGVADYEENVVDPYYDDYFEDEDNDYGDDGRHDDDCDEMAW